MPEARLTRRELEELGFVGFVSFEQLRASQLAEVPADEGVYVVIRTTTDEPEFLDVSDAGWFKRKDPTVSVSTLASRWVSGAAVLYIGRASVNASGRRGLRTRLWEYADYGAGKPVGHRGGRHIWQLAERDSLLVAWRVSASDRTAISDEAELIAEFRALHNGRLPFANIVRPRPQMGTGGHK